MRRYQGLQKIPADKNEPIRDKPKFPHLWLSWRHAMADDKSDGSSSLSLSASQIIDDTSVISISIDKKPTFVDC